MKKLAYAKPAIRVITLYPAVQMLQVSQKVKQIDNTEGFVLDDDGLDNDDTQRQTVSCLSVITKTLKYKYDEKNN